MIYRTRYDRQRHRRRLTKIAVALLAGFILITALDFPILHLIMDPGHRAQYQDWYRMLRVVGFVGTWFMIGIAFALVDRSWWRAGMVALAPLVAGAAAEFIKLLVGRSRPIENGQLLEGWYHFRPFLDGFRDGGNLGMPSSHTAVAFAGAFSLGVVLPRTRPLMLALAAGCAYSRVLMGAHFPSDVFVGAVVGWLISRVFSGLTRRIHGPNAVPSLDP